MVFWNHERWLLIGLAKRTGNNQLLAASWHKVSGNAWNQALLHRSHPKSSAIERFLSFSTLKPRNLDFDQAGRACMTFAS
mmetsp:Transcript_140129/g.244043  ORF Transcript_140129/g.244043 Transcript_140129/m.244043 type:complete len:80 (+) Transcript_140129:214-453(+)